MSAVAPWAVVTTIAALVTAGITVCWRAAVRADRGLHALDEQEARHG